jgi:hypothetical protein
VAGTTLCWRRAVNSALFIVVGLELVRTIR